MPIARPRGQLRAGARRKAPGLVIFLSGDGDPRLLIPRVLAVAPATDADGGPAFSGGQTQPVRVRIATAGSADLRGGEVALLLTGDGSKAPRRPLPVPFLIRWETRRRDRHRGEHRRTFARRDFVPTELSTGRVPARIRVGPVSDPVPVPVLGSWCRAARAPLADKERRR